MKQKHTETSTATPYDDVQRTMLNDCPRLIIPVVNEVFQKQHSDDEEITLLNNELFINRQNGKQIERITDSNFVIGSVRYHLECQSTADGTIMYRIFEYDSQLALKDCELKEGKLTVHFPNTAILYLRHNSRTPDCMEIEIRVSGASCSYTVPVMKVQNYSIDEIFEKRLFFLIPFHIFCYEKDFEQYNTSEQRLQELMRYYEGVLARLHTCAEKHIIDAFAEGIILDMSKKVVEHLAKKYSNVKKGVEKIMGGEILDYPTKDAWKRGIAEGKEAGRAEGRKEQLISQIKTKLDKGKTVQVIAEELEEEVSVIEAMIVEMQDN